MRQQWASQASGGLRVLVALIIVAGYSVHPTAAPEAGLAAPLAPGKPPKPPITLTLYVHVDQREGTGANLRVRPDRNAPIELVIPNGRLVHAAPKPVLGPHRERWYRVTYHGKRGYVRAALLSTRNPKRGPAMVTLYVHVDGHKLSGANLRARPDGRSALELVIPNGTPIRAVKKPVIGPHHEQWYKVTYRRKTGYVRAALLSKHGPRKPPVRPTRTPVRTVTPRATPTPPTGGGGAATNTPTRVAPPPPTNTPVPPPPPTNTPPPPPTNTPLPPTNTPVPPTNTPLPPPTNTPLPTATLVPPPDTFPYDTPAPIQGQGCFQPDEGANDWGAFTLNDEFWICWPTFFDSTASPPATISVQAFGPDGMALPTVPSANYGSVPKELAPDACNGDNLNRGGGQPPCWSWDAVQGDTPGRYTVVAVMPSIFTSQTITVTATFTVNAAPPGGPPKILVYPHTLAAGTPPQIALSGFTANQIVHLYLYQCANCQDSTTGLWNKVGELAPPVQVDGQGETIYTPSSAALASLIGPSATGDYLVLTDPSTLITDPAQMWRSRLATFCLTNDVLTGAGCQDAGYKLP